MYKIGDRVSAPVIIGKPPRHYGTITATYRKKTTKAGRTRYTVTWDDGTVEEEFLLERLQKESKTCSQ